MFTGPRTALAFLTRLPGGRHPADQAGLTAAVPWFPAIGLVVGAIGGAVYVGAAQLVSVLSAATLTFIVTALVTGGFHEDGLADSFDALAGGWSPEHRLEILKDSRHGTFGVLSLVLISLLKVSALASIGGVQAFGALVAAHVVGRAAAVGLMGAAPTAKVDGLGADYTRALTPRATVAGATIGVITAFVVFGWWALAVLAAVTVTSTAVAWWARRKIGGVSGDLLGAAEQIAEATVLLAASAILV